MLGIGIFLIIVGVVFWFLFSSEKKKLASLVNSEYNQIKVFVDRYKGIESELGGTQESSLGLISFNGKVEGSDDMLISPYTETECVYYDFNVEREVEYEEEYTETDEDGEEEVKYRTVKKWEPVKKERKWKEFYVNDGSGKILVNPANATINLQNNRTTNYEQNISDNMYDYINNLESDREVLRYKIEEVYIEEGEQLFIMGGIKIRNGEPVVDKHPDKTFLITDQSRESVIGSSTKNVDVFKYISIGSFILGAILSIVGLF